MNMIYKYRVQMEPFTLELPGLAIVLDVQLQHGIPTMWVLLDIQANTAKRAFFVVGTGHPIPYPEARYLATWQEDMFVWHLFETS